MHDSNSRAARRVYKCHSQVHRFYDITKHEVKQCEAEILNKCSKMEMIERDHRTHLKVHEQKVLNLEYGGIGMK